MTSGVKGGRANIIAIGPDDTLLDVFDRVRAAGQAPLELTIPNESSLFLTAAEFRTLRDVADHGRHAVTIRTPDPLRVQLAKLFGLDVALAAVPVPKPVAITMPTVAEKRVTAEAAAAADAVQAKPQTNQPGQDPAVAGSSDAPAEDPAGTITETEAVARWPVEPVVHQPVPGASQRLRDRVSATIASRRRQRPPVLEPEAEDGEAGAEAAEVEAAPRPAGDGEEATGDDTPDRLHWIGDRRRVSPLVITGVALFAALIIITALNFLLPAAAVTLELVSVPINSELLFDVTESGQPRDDQAAFALPGTPATVTIVYEASVPTTGSEAIPDGAATGTVRLANPTAAEITVAAGTTLTTEAGAEFRIVEPVAVPPVDPVTRAPGQAEGAIAAVDPGTGGNVETGAVGGRLPSGVYYSNRQGPTAGGTDREVQTVAQADLDSLRRMADTGMVELIEAELQASEAETGANPAIVAPTLTVLENDETFDEEIGTAAESVSLRAERTVSVLTYDQTAAAERLTDELGAQLQDTLPDGFQLGPVVLGADDVSVVDSTPGGARFRVNAAARAELALSDAKRTELAQQLAGKGEAEAAALLDGMPEVSGFEIEPGFRLFSSNLPANASRIEIDDDSER